MRRGHDPEEHEDEHSPQTPARHFYRHRPAPSKPNPRGYLGQIRSKLAKGFAQQNVNLQSVHGAGLLIRPPDRQRHLAALIAFPAAETGLQVEHAHVRRQPPALKQADRRDRQVMSARAFDVQEIEGPRSSERLWAIRAILEPHS